MDLIFFIDGFSLDQRPPSPYLPSHEEHTLYALFSHNTGGKCLTKCTSLNGTRNRSTDGVILLQFVAEDSSKIILV